MHVYLTNSNIHNIHIRWWVLPVEIVDGEFKLSILDMLCSYILIGFLVFTKLYIVCAAVENISEQFELKILRITISRLLKMTGFFCRISSLL